MHAIVSQVVRLLQKPNYGIFWTTTATTANHILKPSFSMILSRKGGRFAGVGWDLLDLTRYSYKV